MSRINSREVNHLCEILRKQGPVFRRMIGHNILISVKVKSSPVPVPAYWINTLDHVHRVTGHMNIGAMVANLAELVGPRFIAREMPTFVPAPVAEKIVAPVLIPRLVRPKRRIGPRLISGPLDARQREMKARFKEVIQ